MLIAKAERRIEQYLLYLKQNRYRELFPLDFETFETAETYNSPPENADWEKIAVPYGYGKPWHCSWFRASFSAPTQSRYQLYLRVIPNADSLVFIDGKPAGAFNPVHKKVMVKADGKSHTLHIEADWTRYLTEETRLLSTEIAASGPVCFRIRRKYKIGKASILSQDMVFYTTHPRINFETLVDWREKQRLLKVQFDTAITTAQIRCEVQFGHLFRNTHKNLPQDRARFEFCAHKWVSLEEEGGGIALLNDCKYGHDAEGGRVRLTLLRSPIAPDPDADTGEHRFTYALLPFTGPFGESALVRSGYELNDPARVEPTFGSLVALDSQPIEYSLFRTEGESVITEAIKAPEASASDGGEKRLVIRLYESLGSPAKTVLHFNRTLLSAAETDMLEGNPRELPVAGKNLFLEFRAFEIKTILVTF